MRPFSESCEQNRQVIYETIQPYLRGQVLEIGSGTGQHAVYFTGLKAEISWQTSDLEANLAGIKAWIADADPTRLPAPIALDVLGDWPGREYDLVFTANSFHIMGEPAVAASFQGIAGCLKPGGRLIVYGPFNYNGTYTSASNEQFDQWLKQRDPQSGIRDFEWIETLATDVGFDLLKDIAMPANNRTLIWQNRTL